jgi:uncharacterized membrane protein YfcA
LDFSVPELLGAAGIAAAAGVVRGITGFGSAMVMAPPLALLLGPVLAVPVVMLLEAFAAAPMLVQTRGDVRWRLILPILGAACVTVPLGGYVLLSADPQALRRAIAVLVIVFALLMLRGWRYAGAQRTATGIGLGAVAGAMMGATSIGGPPVILYLLAGPDRIEVTRANLSLFLGAVSFAGVLMLWAGGAIGLAALWLGAMLAPGYCLGMLLGTRLFAHFNDLRFRQFTLLLLITVSSGVLLA